MTASESKPYWLIKKSTSLALGRGPDALASVTGLVSVVTCFNRASSLFRSFGMSIATSPASGVDTRERIMFKAHRMIQLRHSLNSRYSICRAKNRANETSCDIAELRGLLLRTLQDVRKTIRSVSPNCDRGRQT